MTDVLTRRRELPVKIQSHREAHHIMTEAEIWVTLLEAEGHLWLPETARGKEGTTLGGSGGTVFLPTP